MIKWIFSKRKKNILYIKALQVFMGMGKEEKIREKWKEIVQVYGLKACTSYIQLNILSKGCIQIQTKVVITVV